MKACSPAWMSVAERSVMQRAGPPRGVGGEAGEAPEGYPALPSTRHPAYMASVEHMRGTCGGGVWLSASMPV